MRRLKYNSDYMSRQMDKELEALEDRLKAIYANASYDVNAEFAKFAKTFEAKDAEMAKMVAEGSMTDAEYSLWRQRQILQTDLYKASVDKMTVTMLNADITAMATINGDLPMVLAQSYNFVQSLGWKQADDAGLSVGTFQIYNADSVQTIIKDNPDLLKSVDVPVDKKWNKEKINNEIVSSIMKGDPIPKVAENLQKVAKMDENSAIRNARTAMTSAENLGRSESADRLKSQGIPVNEMWNATYDSRTRDTHLMLDGTMRDENGYFGADFLTTPLRYPADPLGDPEEVYNCRCRMSVVLEGIDHSQDGDLYEEFMKSQHPDDWEKMQENKGYQAKQEVIQGALARKESLLEAKAEAQQKEEKESKQIPIMPESVRNAYDTFESKYVDAKVEHGMLFSKDGELLSESKSKRQESVSIASESMYQNLGEGSYEIHNHTAEELFSWKDISNYEKYGINGTITIPSGYEYTLYNTNAPRWDWDDLQKMDYEWLSSAWAKAEEEISDQWLLERRDLIGELQASGLARDEVRTQLRIWEENNSRLGRKEEWLEENAEKYGFIFEKKKIV